MSRTRRHTIEEEEPEISYVERIRPTAFPPSPDGAIEIFRSTPAGIRVLKDTGKRWVAVQFSDEQAPTRAEKDALEAVNLVEPDKNAFSYEPETKLWKRYSNGDHGGNVESARQFAQAMAEGRNVGRGV